MAKQALQKLYSDFLKEYEKLNHMEVICDGNPQRFQIVYLLHVIKESFTTIKLRVVFNASSPTTNGSSLNSQLLIGPKLST